MCGIAGRYHRGGRLPNDGWHLRADQRLAHRGPDGAGYFRDEHCELVHRRLALVDLTDTGHQPMTNEDGTVQVIFNGEIYNHAELRHELIAKGHTFRGTSDTEVLVHMYEDLGRELAHRLRGMFAFAIYDAKLRRVMLARDRFGIKPLYFQIFDGMLVFASEMKAIVEMRELPRSLDRQACFDFLGLGYIPEPATGFAQIQCLPKGSTLVFDRDQSEVRSFSRPRSNPIHRSTDEVIAVTEDALLRAVTRQAVADVPVAALLSGGIDSSLIVAAYCRATRDTPITFNVAFSDAAYDESAFAVQVSRHYNTRHETIQLDANTLTVDSIVDLVSHFDQPFADTSMFGVYAVSRAIRDRGLIATLSGDGGDEAFGGYASFWRANRLATLARLPAPLLASLRRIGTSLVPYTADIGRQVARAADLARVMESSSAALLAGLGNYLDEAQKCELVHAEARRDLLPVMHRYLSHASGGTTDLEAISRTLTNNYLEVILPSDMLRKVDMMAMRAGVEIRVPMLDEDVVDVGLALTHGQKTNGREGKLVLRALAAKWLPSAVARHRKQGFGVPLDRIMTPATHDMLADYLLGRDSRTADVLCRRVVETWLQMFRLAAAGHRGGAISRGGLYQRVFIMLSLELFMRNHALSW